MQLLAQEVPDQRPPGGAHAQADQVARIHSQGRHSVRYVRVRPHAHILWD